jgi:hypothetical protein
MGRCIAGGVRIISVRREQKMRLIVLSLAAACAAIFPAAAQSWKEVSYPAYAISLNFPADPQVETTTYQVADGRSVEAHVYSVNHDNVVLKLTVAELGNTGLDEAVVMDHAIKTLAQGGEIKINFPHRIYSVYGRQLSIAGADGSRSTVALFDYKGRLYQIEGKALAGGNSTDVLRFQQSLVFTDGGSNRSPEYIRSVRESCRGRAVDVANPAGLDDPRCARQ